VTHQARLYFGKTGLARVPLPGGPAAAPFRLESQLLAFHIEPAAAPAPAAAVVSIHIRLLGADNRVLLDETVPSRAPVASNTPAGRVAALAAALTGNLARQAALLRPALAR
ncbi:MAG: hypothetical protein LBR12_06040, partial [Opitutaceae bacterium]|nr:hypothetical protein [Opitutaceae bacterium]